MNEDLKKLVQEFDQLLGNTTSIEHLEQLKVGFLGKKGRFTSLLKSLGSLPPQDRATAGQLINKTKQELQQKIEVQSIGLKKAAFKEQIEKEWIDISIDGNLAKEQGSIHPVTRVQNHLEDVFISMGFQVLDGPHVETEYYNFEALNIPAHHPARDLQDTFYFPGNLLLRTQTSTIQIRGMETLTPPFGIIGSGKVFRCERSDASHDSCFHQLEGMLVGKDISVANLIYFMKTMLTEVFDAEVKVRLRPGYFPFVEPGFELEMSCLLCQGKGCSVCKKVGWIELLGCGMVHPNVLKAGNIDPQEFSGFAFGMGLDRLAMMKYGINDIRYLHGGNLNFMRQF